MTEENETLNTETKNADEQLTPEEQQQILKQIIAESRSRVLGQMKTKSKVVSPNAKKKKKAKAKMQKASRRKNR